MELSKDKLAVERGPFPPRWIVYAVLGAVALHILILLFACFVYFSPETMRLDQVDMRPFIRTRVNVDPAFFKSHERLDEDRPAQIKPPPREVIDPGAGFEEKRAFGKLVETTSPQGGSPPIQAGAVGGDRPTLSIPEGPSELTQLPPSQVTSEAGIIHQASIGEAPALPAQNPNGLVNAAGRPGVGKGTGPAGVPKFQKLAQLLNKKPEEIVKEVKDGGIIRIGDKVLFEFDRASLMPEAIPVLEELAQLFLQTLRDYPGSRIQIDGYTDSFGTEEYNLELSRARALSVKGYLTRAGIPLDRVVTRGLGKTNFIVPPTGTQEEQAPNRRTEFRVLRTR